MRKQYYNYILNELSIYRAINISKLRDYFDLMSFNGKWREAFQYMSEKYYNFVAGYEYCYKALEECEFPEELVANVTMERLKASVKHGKKL